MTLLGSEHSVLIRTKFRSVLQLRLQQRRAREQLAGQGTMPLNHGKFPKQEDSYAFEEDSSSDGLSPEQHHADESPGSAGPSSLEPVGSTPSSSSSPSLTSPRQGGVTRDSSDPGQEEGLSDANRSQPSMPLSVPAIVKSKTSDKNRHKKPKDVKPKVKKLKYHQYIPPDQKAEKSPPPMDSAYARLLQQQQLFLQLQILSQQKHAQSQAHNGHAQHAVHAHQNQAQIPQRQPTFSYQPMATSAPNHKGDHLTPCSSSGPPSAANSTSSSPVKTSYPNQSSLSPVKPGPLPANLDDLKVSELRQQLRVRGMPVSGTKTALIERLRPYRDQGVCDPHLHQHHHHHHLHPASAAMTFPVTPAGSLSQSSYQSPSSSSGAPSQGGYFPYPSTSSTPPISPASSSSELSLSGSLPDSFSDVPMCSPGQRFALLGASPGRAPGVEEGAGGGARGGGGGGEGEGTVEAEKDKMLVEKQKVIEELTWKLHQEQRQVEELKLQLHQRKRCYGSTQDNAPSPTAPHPLSMHHPHQHHQHHPPALGGQQFFGVTIKQEPMSMSSSCPLSSHKPLEELSHCGASHPNAMPVPAGPRCTDPGSAPATGSPQAPMSAFPSPQRSPQSPPSGRAPGSPRSCSPNQPYLLSPPPHLRDGCGLPLPQGRGRHAQMQQKSGGQPLSSPYPSDQRGPHGAFSPGGGGDCGHAHRGHAKAPPLSNPPKMSVLPSPRQVSQTTAFSSSESAVCDLRHPPCYEDAVKQQLSRSQQMDELLDVLIASGGSTALALPRFHRHYEHPGPYGLTAGHMADGHLETLLGGQGALLKLPGEEGPQDEGGVNGDGYGGPHDNTNHHHNHHHHHHNHHHHHHNPQHHHPHQDKLLANRELMDTPAPLSPVNTKLSPDGHGLPGMSFSESPWETMEWLDLTPPSSATAFSVAPPSGPSIFNTEFLDIADINLNSAMDLQLDHW
ncbi:myocardin isoform X2 [Gadus morhua]|uniref:myocardin isoform X2 n=1 Tax=Gadus morhua TaxID=8049 RepID=UPI0011B389D7|nr:myocardin isoform X2 [Gadus morhua]